MFQPVSKEVARARMADVPADKVFWCYGGRVLKNLDELANALREMDDEVFNYHVTAEKNDFTNWVRDVMGDTALARSLLKARSRASAAREVEKRLVWLRARS